MVNFAHNAREYQSYRLEELNRECPDLNNLESLRVYIEKFTSISHTLEEAITAKYSDRIFIHDLQLYLNLSKKIGQLFEARKCKLV